MTIHNLCDILQLNGFTYVPDDGGLEWFDQMTDADDNGDFQYESIQYYQFNGEDFFNVELQVRHNLQFGANSVYLANPSIEDLIKSMEFLKFNKKIELPK